MFHLLKFLFGGFEQFFHFTDVFDHFKVILLVFRQYFFEGCIEEIIFSNRMLFKPLMALKCFLLTGNRSVITVPLCL